MPPKGSSVVTMPSARWCAVDVYNFLQLIENTTPTDCYAIKYIKQQSLPCFHLSPTQLSLFTAYLKEKYIFSFVIYTTVSHRLRVYAKQSCCYCGYEKGAIMRQGSEGVALCCSPADCTGLCWH